MISIYQTEINTQQALVQLGITLQICSYYRLSLGWIRLPSMPALITALAAGTCRPYTKMLQLHAYTPEGSKVHRFASFWLPSLLKAPNTTVRPTSEVHLHPLLGAVGTLVTLLTQLGIPLTFGAIIPPVALAMAVSITSVLYGSESAHIFGYDDALGVGQCYASCKFREVQQYAQLREMLHTDL